MVKPSLPSQTPAASPFQQRAQVRLGFGTMVILLLMVVGAGVGLLIYYAMRVPAITSEVNAWLGRAPQPVDTQDARLVQLKFALFLYTAPLGLGMLVYFLHFAVNWIDRRLKSPAENDEYRMD